MQKREKKDAGVFIMNNSLYQHIFFWILVVAYSSSMIWQVKKDFSIIIRSVIFEIPLQIGIAYSILYFFIPRFLNKNRYFLFFKVFYQ